MRVGVRCRARARSGGGSRPRCVAQLTGRKTVCGEMRLFAPHREPHRGEAVSHRYQPLLERNLGFANDDLLYRKLVCGITAPAPFATLSFPSPFPFAPFGPSPPRPHRSPGGLGGSHVCRGDSRCLHSRVQHGLLCLSADPFANASALLANRCGHLLQSLSSQSSNRPHVLLASSREQIGGTKSASERFCDVLMLMVHQCLNVVLLRRSSTA